MKLGPGYCSGVTHVECERREESGIPYSFWRREISRTALSLSAVGKTTEQELSGTIQNAVNTHTCVHIFLYTCHSIAT